MTQSDSKPVGRPTDYSQSILDKAAEYSNNFKSLGDVVPQIAGLALYLNVSRETIYAWEKDEDKKEFSYIVSQIRANQERNLVNGGVSGEFAPKITGMMLAKHGYSESTKTELSGTVELAGYTDEQINARIAALLNN